MGNAEYSLYRITVETLDYLLNDTSCLEIYGYTPLTPLCSSSLIQYKNEKETNLKLVTFKYIKRNIPNQIQSNSIQTYAKYTKH
uniref:Uncharacterized protein n=1 Tax=Schistosoma haematobium TaxID=6185 RepID=A0A095AQQ9_SCHHA